jgi:hypothetical protein
VIVFIVTKIKYHLCLLARAAWCLCDTKFLVPILHKLRLWQLMYYNSSYFHCERTLIDEFFLSDLVFQA